MSNIQHPIFNVEVNPLKADPATGEILAEAESILACVDDHGKIRRIPEFMYPDV